MKRWSNKRPGAYDGSETLDAVALFNGCIGLAIASVAGFALAILSLWLLDLGLALVMAVLS